MCTHLVINPFCVFVYHFLSQIILYVKYSCVDLIVIHNVTTFYYYKILFFTLTEVELSSVPNILSVGFKSCWEE